MSCCQYCPFFLKIIYGHGDAEGLVYKAIPFRDSRVCYIDEKDKNLREIALDSVYPLDSDETSLKGILVAQFFYFLVDSNF